MTKKEIEAYRARAAELIKDNPIIALLAALALGFLVAKVTAKEKIIVIEKTKS